MSTTPDLNDLLPKEIIERPIVPSGMRLGTVYRQNDESGVSGAGIIIQFCLYANGMVAIQWLVGPDPGDIQIKNWEKFLDTHVRSHPGNGTIITFANSEQLRFEPEQKPLVP